MQDMVAELDDMRRKRIFDDEEIRHIVNRRREFEYALQKLQPKRQDFLSYVRYEVALECLRSRRSKKVKFDSKSLSDHSGVRRLHIIFNRAVRQFKGDMRMWYQYVDFCLRSGSTKILERVLLRALRFHPREVPLWLLAADRALKCGHLRAARTLLSRGIRAVPRSAKIWGEFLRLEVQVASCFHANRSSDSAATTAAAAAEAPGGAAAAGAAAAPAAAVPKGGATEEGAAATAASAAAPAGDAAEEGAARPAKDPWAPPRMLLSRALGRLAQSPQANAAFLAVAVQCLKSTATHWEEDQGDEKAKEGLKAFGQQVRAALAERRPGVAEGRVWAEASKEAAQQLWQLWWQQERACGVEWGALTEATAGVAPGPALQQLAAELAAAAAAPATGGEKAASGGAGESGAADSGAAAALVRLAEAPRAAEDVDTALAVLEALERCVAPDSAAPKAAKDATAEAARGLLARTAVALPNSARLRLLAWRKDPTRDGQSARRIAHEAKDTDTADCVALKLLASTEGPEEAPKIATRSLLEVLVRALAADAASAPLVVAHIAQGLAAGGQEGLRAACDEARQAAKTLWDLPRRRAEVLAAALDAELRCSSAALLSAKGAAAAAQLARRLGGCFEELLSELKDDNPEKELWWIRYVELVHRAGSWGIGDDRRGKRCLPSTTDLHWRALRSVPDQARYNERVHRLLHQVPGADST